MPIVGNEGDDGDGGPSGGGGCGGALGPASPNDDALGGPSSSNGKISKAAVLQRSIDYIHYIQVSVPNHSSAKHAPSIIHSYLTPLQAQKKKQEDELSQLRKEVVALQIMKANYEQLVKAHRQGAAAADLRDGDGDTAVPSDVKFEVRCMIKCIRH